MKNERKWLGIIIVISLAFAAIIFFVKPPQVFDDLTRFYEYYERLTQFSIGQFLSFLSKQPDFILPIIIFLGTRLGTGMPFLLAVITFVSSFLVLFTSWQIEKKYQGGWFLLAIVSAINVAGLLSGVRNFFSVALVYRGLYLLYGRKKIFGAFALYVSAFFTHFSAILFLPLLFLTPFKKKDFKWLFFIAVFLGAIFCLIIRFSIVQGFSLPLPEAFVLKLHHYLGAQEFWQFNSIKEYIVSIILASWFILFLPYCYQLYKNKQTINSLEKVLMMLCLLMIITASNNVIFTRISYLTKFLWVVSLYNSKIWEFRKIKFATLYLLVLFILQFCLYFEGIFNFIK